MEDTFLARYKKGTGTITAFLTRKDALASGKRLLKRYADYAAQLGEGFREVARGPVLIILCDMGGAYDALLQKGDLVAGVTEVPDPEMALDWVKELWAHLLR